MEKLQIHSRVGTDGVLRLDMPLGREIADADVLVTIEPVAAPLGTTWSGFLHETFGERAPEEKAPVRWD